MKHIKIFETYIVDESDEVLYQEIDNEDEVIKIYDGANNINQKTISKIEKYISSQKNLDKFGLVIDYDALHDELGDDNRLDVLFILSNETEYHKNYRIREYRDSWFTVVVNILTMKPFDVKLDIAFKCDGLAGVYQLISRWGDFKIEEKEEE